jgi:aminopeptidase N
MAGLGTPGSDGLGDPFFPLAGNGGYNVAHYDLGLDWHSSGKLDGHAAITATATQDLSSFDLDLRQRLDVDSLEVNGTPKSFTREGQELIVDLGAAPVLTAMPLNIDVEYSGKPRFVRDPDNSKDGWVPTHDGAVVVNEPQGAPTWFPCNDHPLDKATFDISVEVPKGLKAISNGTLEDKVHNGDRVEWDWHENDPMATYLSTATIGKFHLDQGTAGGVPSYVAVQPGTDPGATGKIDAVLDFFSAKFGTYPFDASGAIVDPSDVGYSLEVQTKPYFPGGPDQNLLAHELAHQWFGDAVSLEQFPEMWLNEGFATWSQWFWGQHTGGKTTGERFDDLYAAHGPADSFWTPPPADLGEPSHLFDFNAVYQRGAMTLEALRGKVGNETFFEILNDWISGHLYGNGSIQDFIDLVKADSDVPNGDLDTFFQNWLYEEGKPPLP